MAKKLLYLLLFFCFSSVLAQPLDVVPGPLPPGTAVDTTTSATTTTTTTGTTTSPSSTVSPGATITQPAPPVTPAVVVTPNQTTIAPTATTSTITTTPSTAAPTPTIITAPIVTPPPTTTTETPSTTLTSTGIVTTPVNLGPNMMFVCSGKDPNWHLEMTTSGIHFTAPTIATTFTATPPITTTGGMQGSILVYTTATHDSKPATVVITKNDMGCRAAPGGSSKIDSFVILTNKVFVGCCMPK